MDNSKTMKRILTQEEHEAGCDKQLERLGYKDKQQTTQEEQKMALLVSDILKCIRWVSETKVDADVSEIANLIYQWREYGTN